MLFTNATLAEASNDVHQMGLSNAGLAKQALVAGANVSDRPVLIPSDPHPSAQIEWL